MADIPAMTRSRLLDEFSVIASQHFQETPTAETRELLAKLVAHIPYDGLASAEPKMRITFTGEIDAERAGALLDDIWGVDYTEPKERPLELVMSSPGGDVAAAGILIAELSNLRRRGRKLNIHVGGFAMSSAFDILQIADYRTAEPTASFMVHHEHFTLPEDAAATEHTNEGRASIARAKIVFAEWGKRTGRNVDFYMKQISTGNWYFDADKALAEGLIDEIIASPGFAKTPHANGTRRPRKTKDAPAE